MSSKSATPLPFGDTLKDLALLRASDIDFSSLLPPPSSGEGDLAIDSSVARSYEFVKESRVALKLHYRNDVEKQGTRVEDVRSRLEDVLNGLDVEQ